MDEKFKILLQAILLFLIIMGGCFFFSYVIFGSAPENNDAYDLRFLLFQLGVDISFALSVLLGIKLYDIKFTNSWRLPKQEVVILLLFLGLFLYVVNPLFYPVSFFDRLALGKLYSFQFYLPAFELNSDIYIFVKGLLLAPVYEEIFYRKIIFGKLKDYFPTFLAVVISSLLFAIGHLEWERLLELFIIGCIICLIYERTKSLSAVILFHSFTNILGYLLEPIDIVATDYYAHTMVFIVCVVGFIWCLRKMLMIPKLETGDR